MTFPSPAGVAQGSPCCNADDPTVVEDSALEGLKLGHRPANRPGTDTHWLRQVSLGLKSVRGSPRDPQAAAEVRPGKPARCAALSSRRDGADRRAPTGRCPVLEVHSDTCSSFRTLANCLRNSNCHLMLESSPTFVGQRQPGVLGRRVFHVVVPTTAALHATTIRGNEPALRRDDADRWLRRSLPLHVRSGSSGGARRSLFRVSIHSVEPEEVHGRAVSPA